MPTPKTDDLYSYFDAMSHEQLLAMVHSADPKSLSARHDALTSAATTLDGISKELASHATNLEWTGDAATQFKGWLQQVSAATESLSTYVSTTGAQILIASDALSSAKNMPSVPQDQVAILNKRAEQLKAYPNLTPRDDASYQFSKPGWVTAQNASDAQTAIANAKNEAVDAMVRLSQAYEGSADTIQGQNPVLFPPNPQDVMGPKPLVYDGSTDLNYGGSSGNAGPSTRTRGGGGTVTPPPTRTPPPVVEPTPPPHFVQPPVHWKPPPVVEPNPVTPPHDPTPTPTPPPSTGIDHTKPPVTTPPGQGGGTSGALPNGPGTNGQSGHGLGGLPGGFPGGYPGGGSLKGGASGQYGSINGTGGSSYGGSTGGYGGLRGGGRIGGGGAGSEEGITGGVSRPGSVSGRSQLGNNVIGAEEGEEAAAGRAGGLGGGRGGYPAGGMGGGAIGGRGAGGAGRGGRGLLSKPGGEVGGHAGPEPEGEFTRGGSGLGKASSSEARAGETEGEGGYLPGGPGSANKRRKDRRSRADYLVEDEETWTGDTPQSNPDVIE